MRMRQLFKFEKLENYWFSDLPKGNMLEISMNPYNGNVFMKPEKHAASTTIALEIMREVVRACDVYERNGSEDPLRDLLSDCNGSNFKELVSSAKGESMKAVKGERKACPSVEEKKAS